MIASNAPSCNDAREWRTRFFPQPPERTEVHYEVTPKGRFHVATATRIERVKEQSHTCRPRLPYALQNVVCGQCRPARGRGMPILAEESKRSEPQAARAAAQASRCGHCDGTRAQSTRSVVCAKRRLFKPDQGVVEHRAHEGLGKATRSHCSVRGSMRDSRQGRSLSSRQLSTRRGGNYEARWGALGGEKTAAAIQC